MELVLGIGSPIADLDIDVDLSSSNITAAITAAAGQSTSLNSEVKAALLQAVPILVELGPQLGLSLVPPSKSQRQPLVTR